jgi:hypothetical protein
VLGFVGCLIPGVNGLLRESLFDPTPEDIDLALGDPGCVRRHVRLPDVGRLRIDRDRFGRARDDRLAADAAGDDTGVTRQIELTPCPFGIVTIGATLAENRPDIAVEAGDRRRLPLVLRRPGDGDGRPGSDRQHNRQSSEHIRILQFFGPVPGAARPRGSMVE